jgi:ABC-type phosphate transport system substrate-binding protein
MRPLWLLGMAVCLTILSLGGGLLAEAAPELGYQLIIEPDNQNTTVDRSFLADAFLKKVTVWPNGEVVRPVDLASHSPARKRFTEDVLKRSVGAVKSYWQQRIFAGRDVPPPELETDEEVVTYVLKHQGAVGYVSGSADLRGAKAISLR